MIFQKQLFHHKPEEGEFGDCHRTAIACILDLKQIEIFNFGEYYGDMTKFQAKVDSECARLGYKIMELPFTGDYDSIMRQMEHSAKGVLWIMGGTSRNGTGHSVVCEGGNMLWDPSLDDTGIIGPHDDGFYWASFLIPIELTYVTKPLV